MLDLKLLGRIIAAFVVTNGIIYGLGHFGIRVSFLNQIILFLFFLYVPPVLYTLFKSYLETQRYIKQIEMRFGRQTRETAAVHEAGHSVWLLVSKMAPLQKIEVRNRLHITLIRDPEGIHRLSFVVSGGVTATPPLPTLETLPNVISLILAGMVAEQACLGSISTGSSSDLGRAVSLARDYVGLSGHRFLRDGAHPLDFRTIVAEAMEGDISEGAKRRIEEECSKLLAELYEKVTETIQAHRPTVEAIAKALQEKGRLNPSEIQEIWNSTTSSAQGKPD